MIAPRFRLSLQSVFPVFLEALGMCLGVPSGQLPSTLRGTLSGKADALYGDIGDMEVARSKPYSSRTREVAAALSSPGLIHLPSPRAGILIFPSPSSAIHGLYIHLT